MSSFPGSPRLQKGAIIGLDPFNPLASLVVFQYNPEKLTRTISPNAMSGQGQGSAISEAMRLKGPPTETIKAELVLDAADQLEQGSFPTTAMGVYPTLSSLEMLLYPKTAMVIANEVLAKAGIIEIIPPEAPLTLFIWGLKRIVPVRLTDLSITEESFDTDLNPIRATVSVGMRVLTYQDLGLLSVGGGIQFANQVIKETMASIGGIGGITGLGSISLGASFSIGG